MTMAGAEVQRRTVEDAARARDLDEAEYVRRATAVFLDRARDARHDPCDFYSFVMREEHTQKSLTVSPHQRIFIEFAMAHRYSVIMLPVGTGKTFGMGALGLYQLGLDPLARGGIVSAAEEQAAKVLGMIADYIEHSDALHAVFPDLRRSPRTSDDWNEHAITVDRPYGIRDPSVVAHGMKSQRIKGARLSWVVVDDVLTFENTLTKEQRDKVQAWFESSVLDRLDPKKGRITVTNTAWHSDDLLHRLVAPPLRWPMLRMDVEGGIEIRNTDWDPKDADMLRPELPGALVSRLTAHDPDPKNEVPLWPYRYSRADIAELRRTRLPKAFNQSYMNLVRDDDTALCKQEYIDACKRKSREKEHFHTVREYKGSNLTVTGVDLAFRVGEENDQTAFFTIELLPSGHRKILDIEVGRWPSPVTMKKAFEKAQRYNSIIAVENNGAQVMMAEMMVELRADVPVREIHTGIQKAHPELGLVSMFVEMFNGAWLIPNDRQEFTCEEAVESFCKDCLDYNPAKHTSDVLMAAYMARQMLRELGVASGGEVVLADGNAQTGMSIMAR